MILLPIEVDARETLAKFLLATEIASRGHVAAVGYKGEIEPLATAGTTRSAILLKGPPATNNLSFAQELKEYSVTVIAQDEESGISYNKFATYRKVRRGLDNIESLDRYLCWGQDDYRALSEEYPAGGFLKLTGSPRVSLWGATGRIYFQEESEAIRERMDNFLLIGTNFAFSTNFYASRGYLKWASKNLPTSYVEYAKDTTRSEERIHRELAERVVRIAKAANASGVRVAIKCHPSEDPRFYKENLPTGSGTIVASGPIGPWIHACDWFLHHGSTAGIEALMATKPVGYLSVDTGSSEVSQHLNSGIYGSANLESLESVEAFIHERRLPPDSLVKEIAERKIFGVGTLEPVRGVASQLLQGLDNSSGLPGMRANLGDMIRGLGRRMGLTAGASSRIARSKRPGISLTRARHIVGRSAHLLGVEVPAITRIGVDSYFLSQARRVNLP